MNIAIRSDGSPFIGMGHVMRCLSLAAVLRQSGHNVEFISRFEPGLSRIREQGFAVQHVMAGLPDGAGKEFEPAQDTEAAATTDWSAIRIGWMPTIFGKFDEW